MPQTLPRFEYAFDAESRSGSHPFAAGAGGETEWLLTNGRGGFAMGTVAGVNTRRYHGLLVSASRPPVDRYNQLNQVGETALIGRSRYELHTHEFHDPGGGVCHPKGFRELEAFEKSTAVTWTYRLGPVRLHKTLRLLWREPVGLIRYRLEPVDGEAIDEPVGMEVRPFLAMRDFHQLRTNQDWFDVRDRVDGDCNTHVVCSVHGAPPLFLSIDRGHFRHAGQWWDNFRYRRESERQQDDREDLFVPGVFETELSVEQPTLTLMFGTVPLDLSAGDAPDSRRPHLVKAIHHVTESLGLPDPVDATDPEDRSRALAALVGGADDFVVERTVEDELSTTIMAGYPWFSDWGRDTMIALPGCLLVTGRFAEARQTLATFAAHVREGLIPNRFDDRGGDPHYNTVDAPLWFVHAALEYRRLADDRRTWSERLQPACRQIIDYYREGTHFDIRMDPEDGLITAGNPWTQLTWMDAARDGVVFTPRWGKAVEINALWHNAVAGLATMEKDRGLKSLARQIKRSFNATFWSAELGYLIDHIHPGWESQPPHVDRSLRPNQIFAVSLPDAPLAQRKQRSVMKAVRKRLLTPYGLRTLPEDDPAYHGRYAGSMFERDEAYHQGTVWPWLIGHYVEGYLKAHRFTKKSQRHAADAIAPLLAALDGDALGQLHEVYDGSPPQRGQGCPAQAWSVAEVLRAAVLIESA